MRKILTTAVLSAATLGVLGIAAAPAMAASTPHITGSFSMSGPAQYETINNVSASGSGSLSYTNFEAQDTAASGVWSLHIGQPIELDFAVNGSGTYPHTMIVDSIQPTGLSSFTFTGHGNYVADPSYHWTATGSVSGSVLALHVVYDTNSTDPGFTMDISGTINPDGSVTALPINDGVYSRVLTPSMPAGSAFQAFDFTAPVTSATVGAASGQFSFLIPAGHLYAGSSVAVAVTDGGSPGPGHDTYAHGFGSPTNPYTITGGNLTVH